MATIIKRKNPSGETVYRVQIRINKKGYPPYSESRTFSTRALAVSWGKRRETEIEQNPDILLGIEKKHTIFPTLEEAINRYLHDVKDGFGRSKKMGLLFLQSFPIGKIRINRLKRSDFVEHALLRRNGIAEKDIAPVAASTALQDLQYMRSVLKYAHYSLGMDVNWAELDFAVENLRANRIVGSSEERDRLPTSQELQDLTTFFYQSWTASRKLNKIPMHLVMWLAIYSCRRQDELCYMQIDDLDRDNKEWLIRDVKHPLGSKGNHKRSWVNDDVLKLVDILLNDDDAQQRMNSIRVYDNALLGISPKSVSSAFTRACKVLGIEDLRFHDLRHEGATRLAEDGMNLPTIQKFTLHSSWKALERYVNLRKRKSRLDFDEAMRCVLGE